VQDRIIAYYRKTLKKAKRNNCITRREHLHRVRTLEHFHRYLNGQEFYLRTDHCALNCLMSFKNFEGQTARWVKRLKIQLYFRISTRPETQMCQCPLNIALPRKIYALSQGRVTGRQKVTTSYFRPTRIRQGSAGSENGTAKRHRHRALFAGSRNRTPIRGERQRRADSHIQKLLGPVAIARCKKRRTRAEMGIRQRTIQSSPNSSPSEQSGGLTDRTTRCTFRRSPGCQ
jgi:hypothetical protein